MEFAIKKCAILIMKEGKREIMEGIALSNHECTGALWEKENYKYLGILEEGTIKQTKMKEKVRK